MSKYLIGAILAAVAIFGLYRWGYANGKASVELTDSKTMIKQTGEARAVEQAVIIKQSDLDLNYQKGAIDAQKGTQVLVDSLLSGAVRMHVPDPTPAVSRSATGTSKRHASTTCELPGKTAADLTQLAADADANTRQLRLCQDTLTTYLSVVPMSHRVNPEH